MRPFSKDFEIALNNTPNLPSSLEELHSVFCVASFIIRCVSTAPGRFEFVGVDPQSKGHELSAYCIEVCEDPEHMTIYEGEMRTRMSGSALLRVIPSGVGILFRLSGGKMHCLTADEVALMRDMPESAAEDYAYEDSLYGDFIKSHKTRNLGFALPRFMRTCFFVAGGFNEGNSEPGFMVQRHASKGSHCILISESPFDFADTQATVLLRRTGFDLLERVSPTVDFAVICGPKSGGGSAKTLEYLDMNRLGWMRQCIYNHGYGLKNPPAWSGYEPLRASLQGFNRATPPKSLPGGPGKN